MRSGTWHLRGPKKTDTPKELRYPRFLKNLTDLVEDCRSRYRCEPVLAYEEVNFVKSTDQITNHGAMRALVFVVSFMAAQQRVVHRVPTGTWKRLVVHNGSAKKPEYIGRINQLLGLELEEEDEDHAAALGVGLAVLLKEFHDEQAQKASVKRRRKGRRARP